MSSETDTVYSSENPPAFPDGDGCRLGMTLRDWFAGQALNGLLAAPDIEFSEDVDLAAISYKWADDMLEKRSKA